MTSNEIEWTELDVDEQFETEVTIEPDSLLAKLNPLHEPETQVHRITKYIPFSLPMMCFYACECGEHTFSGTPPASIREDLQEAQERVVEEGDYEPWMLEKAGVNQK